MNRETQARIDRLHGRRGLRIALVTPRWETSDNPGALPDLYPPLGLGYLASILRQRGHEPLIVDMPVRRLSTAAALEEVKAFEPDVVGFTCATVTFLYALDMLPDFRRALPETPFILGGVHPTLDPVEAASPELVDLAVVGEAEVTLPELLDCWAQGGDMERVAGLAWRGDDGEVNRTAVRPLIEDLDALPPPAWDLFDMRRYRRLGRMDVLTARGCPFRCIFCATSAVWRRTTRFRGIGPVVDEIAMLVDDYGFRHINIYDSTFTADPRRAAAICEEITRRGLRFNWRTFARVNPLPDGTLEAMSRAGCNHILFGVESLVPRTLKLLRKGITPDQVRRAFDRARAAGLNRVAYMIIGLPGETREDVLWALERAKELDAEHYVVGALSPIPGTELFDRLDELGITMHTRDWRLSCQDYPMMSTSELSREEINELVDYAVAYLNEGRAGYDWTVGRCPVPDGRTSL